jgi:hypothetical protein
MKKRLINGYEMFEQWKASDVVLNGLLVENMCSCDVTVLHSGTGYI